MNTKRVCIYPKDIQLITGKTERHGRRILQTIRENLNKEPHQFVTIQEFSEYSGIEVEVINQYIN